MRRRHKLIIWGPGDMGGQALRTALASPDFDVVGVKVFSPHKDGVDIGELVGLPAVGVTATTDKQAILDLEADCVIHTPTTPALMKGADDDVIDLLESGKNVVSAASYHNVSMANWLTESRPPLDILRTLATMRTTGAVPGPQERQAITALRWAMRAVDSPLAAPVRPLVQTFADKSMDRAVPRRRTGERIQQACLRGGVSLHGTGLHPGLMVEQVVLRLAGLLDEVREVGFLEVGDLSAAPDGMWGGLSSLGFGTELSAVNSDHAIALAQHFYFDAVLGNVAHALFGAHSRDVRVERHVYPVPARVEVTAGGTVIRPGTVGAIHMTYRGYLGDRLFMTNEECWHVGPGNAHLGPDHPDSHTGGHVIRLDGLPGRIDMRNVAADDAGGGDWSAVTHISVKAMLDIVAAVCAAPPGAVIADLSPRYQLEAL
ncbi:hypothetical protein [Nocardia alba]|uniref:Dihydrodipicolinate reductase-like protein n=1 Tax=Nocardia alba TaxID=225051 RepID=A0A4V2PAU1_9NOCA|nr:hypothetical protein [Nocardia alba]TCJ94935.1 dihydrodipicolinate reductase-like protein [Nocardia alba]